MDISRDDRGYITIIENRENYGDRDIFWHGLVSILSELDYGYRAVLVVTALFLLIKLYLIQKFLDRRIPALFLYVAIFWQLHDLTQIRLACAMAFIFFVVFAERGICLKNQFLLAASGAFHTQTLTLLISQFNLLCVGWRGLALLFFSSYLIVQVGFFEVIKWFDIAFFIDQLGAATIGSLLLSYASQSEAQGRIWQTYPAIIVASFSIFIYCFYRMRACSDAWIRDASNAIAFSILLVMLFSALNDVMVRFHEMFLVYSILLIGKCSDLRSSFALLVLGFLYFIKFNVIWTLLEW